VAEIEMEFPDEPAAKQIIDSNKGEASRNIPKII
jgi:hypothetical protein